MLFRSDYLYIGVGDNEDEKEKFYFKGLVSEFAIWNIGLDDLNVKEIYENSFAKSLLNDYRKYNKSKFLKCYFDFKHFKQDVLQDLSGNNNNGLMENCEDGYLINKFETSIIVPIRREGKFKTLKHSSNSVNGNKWVHYETRKNQIRFYNEMKGRILDLGIDGLNTCRYTELNRIENDGVIHLKVEL